MEAMPSKDKRYWSMLCLYGISKFDPNICDIKRQNFTVQVQHKWNSVCLETESQSTMIGVDQTKAYCLFTGHKM